MSKTRAPQKLVSFSDNKNDLNRIRQDIAEGWAIISLMQNGNYYIGVMEKLPTNDNNSEDKKIYIPPRKKIKISF